MQKLPACIGIILDGNRRWAKANGLPKLEGHRRGLVHVSDCARWVRDRGVRHLALYALSTENLHRTKEEVSYLMDLAVEMAENQLAELGRENIRARFAGDMSLLPQEVRAAAAKVEAATASNTGMTLWVCLAYGARAELAAAANAAANRGKKITEEVLAQSLWTAGMPDPDIIIRTGGEKRLSNFLLWQAAYSELFFIDAMWPDFSEEVLDAVLAEYATRERRNGR